MKRWIELQSRLEEVLLAGAILLMAGMMVANVVTRSLFGFSLAWNEELAQFLIVLVCFVGLSYGAAKRRHIRMTAVVEQLPPRPRRLLAVAIALATSALMLLLTMLAVRYVVLMADLGSVSPVLGVPLYLVYASAPIGLLLAAFHSAHEAWATWRGTEPSPAEPLGVEEPSLERAGGRARSPQAQREAGG